MEIVLTKENCKYWNDDFKYMMLFLHAQQLYFNNIYKAKCRVSLDSVFQALGVDIPPDFPFLGWTKTNNPDNYIDFGICGIAYRSFVDSWFVKAHKRHYSDGKIVTVKGHIKTRVNTPRRIVLCINCPTDMQTQLRCLN